MDHGLGSTTIINNNHVHINPYPNVAGPGQPAVCEAGNESYEAGKAVTGNLPIASVSKNRELTTREENLFSEKYESSTLKALGLATPSTKPKSKSKAKAKAK